MVKASNNKNSFFFFFYLLFVLNKFNLNVDFFIIKKFHAISKLNSNGKTNFFKQFVNSYSKSLKMLKTTDIQPNPNQFYFLYEDDELGYKAPLVQIVSDKHKTFFNSFLNLFFALNFSNYSTIFKNSKFSKFFFFNNKGGRLQITNSKKLINRWLNSIDFLYTLNYFYLKPLVMTMPFFKKECLAFNWFFTKWDISFWKLCFPFFLHQTNRFTKSINYFYSKLNDITTPFFIVTDCIYHWKNLYYLRKHYFYTIGFVSLSGNPWVVNYPIINMFESLTNQSFFFKILSYISKLAHYHQFLFFKRKWLVLSHQILLNA